ncbi:hypothetical protein IWQ61_009200, partial [Dispira simplex]
MRVSIQLVPGVLLSVAFHPAPGVVTTPARTVQDTEQSQMADKYVLDPGDALCFLREKLVADLTERDMVPSTEIYQYEELITPER